MQLRANKDKVENEGSEEKPEVDGDGDNFEKKRSENEATMGFGEKGVLAEDKSKIKVDEDQAKNKVEVQPYSWLGLHQPYS